MCVCVYICMYVNQLAARYPIDCMKAKAIGLFLVWVDSVTFDHRLSSYAYVYECERKHLLVTSAYF